MKGLKSGNTVSHLKLKEKKYIKGNGTKGKISWVCDCVCGREVIRREDSFVEGKIMSCGCKHPSKQRCGSSSTIWKGCGLLSGQFFSMIRKGAENRNLVFDITIQDAWDVFQGQRGLCKLTSIPLTFAGYRERRRGIEQTASLDRINSDMGYVQGNVQWVHKDVNMMKKEYAQERYIDICMRVALKHMLGY